MAETSKTRKKYWDYWTRYVRPLGLEPTLQGEPYDWRIRSIIGFVSRVRSGWYGNGSQIRVGSVRSALTAIGKTSAMANGINPTKVFGSDKLAPRLQQQMDGYNKLDPPTKKKLPVEVDVPECIAAGKTQGCAAKRNKKYRSASLMAAIGDLCLITFYYLLRIGEYTVKGSRNEKKQTKQFRLEDATFFRRDQQGKLRQLPRNSPDNIILSADSATL